MSDNSEQDNYVFLAAKDAASAKSFIRGAMKGASLPDSILTNLPDENEPVLFDSPEPRTGVLQEEFRQNQHGTGRAKIKLHIVDFQNSNEKDGLRIELCDEEVEAYCPVLASGETIAKDTTVVLVYINSRWTIILGGGGTTTSGETGIIQEPCRRPLFRNVEPGGGSRINLGKPKKLVPADNVFECLGSIKLPGKTYSPIKATYYGDEKYKDKDGKDCTREPGELMKDKDGKQLYLKKRVPKTSSDMLVLRQGDDTSLSIEWIYADGTKFNNDNILPSKPAPWQQGWGSSEHHGGEPLWETTTDPENAQLDYDYALCRNLDWAELLIEGDEVKFTEKTVDIEVDGDGSGDDDDLDDDPDDGDDDDGYYDEEEET